MPEGAIVTGASSGIGAAVAVRLQASFKGVVGIDLVEPATGWPPCVVADVCHPDALAEASIRLGDSRLDAVIHCAGMLLDEPLIETRISSFEEIIRVNVLGTHNIVTSAIAKMRGRGGTIVIVTSQLARRPASSRGAYSATKAALERMIPDYARECGSVGIRVIGVAPGPVATDMTKSRFGRDDERHAVEAHMTANSILEPDQIAGVIEFLLSKDAYAINGSVVVADGGFLAYG